jgi:hypothetical protein
MIRDSESSRNGRRIGKSSDFFVLDGLKVKPYS